MHRIAVLALPGVVASDLAAPCDLFSRVRDAHDRPAYEVRVCGLGSTVDAGHFQLQPPWRLASLQQADTVIVPGLHDPLAPVPPAALRALQAASQRGTRIASICTGAFVLGAAGLLDGRRATTHWLAAEALQARHPTAVVDPLVLYVDAGRVLTSAGAAAGLDLCLYLVQCDLGAAAAARAARMAVLPLGREGGQAQFIRREAAPPDAGSLQPLLAQITAKLGQAWDLATLARAAHTSERTLNRRFLEQTGLAPLQWLRAARVRAAQELLETTALSVERIADLTGFGSATGLRRHFLAQTGTGPQRYRAAFAPALQRPRSLNPG